ncbi:hypothetical protein P167DRAFT_540394 [Morchella conica CCBAS932]|uniref:Uncharacterized protein n=1 Tax=Morchella conica CCBAS932 TaxID=1392247 RepID=A0A3N4KCN7_9PEZI|nr:hypothetical protein P167DRAFT_540394 [Morchella conica CCBAS932]
MGKKHTKQASRANPILIVNLQFNHYRLQVHRYGYVNKYAGIPHYLSILTLILILEDYQQLQPSLPR